MVTDEWIDQLLRLDSGPTRKLFLEQHRDRLDLPLVQALKSEVDHLMRANQAQASQAAELILSISELTGDPEQRAIGLVAKANVQLIAHGEFGPSIDLYDQASAIYRELDLPIDQARTQTGKVAALASLGRYEEAIDCGRQALTTLEEHDRADLTMGLASNIGLAYGHAGDDSRSLQMFDRAAAVHALLGGELDSIGSLIQMNRSFALRAIGRYTEAIEAGEAAIEGFTRAEEPADAARARLHLALTYYLMGHYARALNLLQQSREDFLADERMHDVAQVDLFQSDCLLEMRRFDEVIELCRAIRRDFADRGAIDLIAQMIVNESVALTKLDRHQEALKSLEDARHIFEASDNQLWLRATRLKSAQVLRALGRQQDALDLAAELADALVDSDLPLDAARARLVAGRAAMDLGLSNTAEEHLNRARSLASGVDLPDIGYQVGLLEGAVLQTRGQKTEALLALDQALDSLERQGSQMMLEHRISFLEDKAGGYAAAAGLALDLGNAAAALGYVERAKSRALLELLAGHVAIGIRPRSTHDQELVDRLLELRSERDRRYRKRQADLLSGERGRAPFVDEQDLRSISEVETKITQLWHQLLLRDPTYAHQASLWQPRAEPFQSLLDPASCMLEYFLADGELLAFVVSADQIEVRRTSLDNDRLMRLLHKLRLNMGTVPTASDSELPALRRNADGVLEALYQQLIQPIADLLPESTNLVIVPHGPLHYVPFHALRTQGTYLIEQRAISYLPAASVLAYCRQVQPKSQRALAIGYSSQGALPHAVLEANQVADLLSGEALLESRASMQLAGPKLPELAVLHVAAHGDYRADNPLFSGLALADGELTVLDIFGLELHASLVTLSACRTGQSVIGGGDELLGLMRAFLAAGAASIVLSLWAVEDRSTAALMELLYSYLATGEPKAGALRSAQTALLTLGTDDGSPDWSHPYYWAPFMLVGDEGPL